MVTVLLDEGPVEFSNARADGDALWLPADALAQATGWQLKPEGLCKDEVCVPVPAGQEAAFARGGDVNLAAFWRHLGRPVLHDESAANWALGQGARERGAHLRSLEAPDFTLPDLDGRSHSLRDYRGRRVFLATWASW